MKMTLTRALAELKMLDKRIEKTINESQYIAYEIGNKGIKGFQQKDEFITYAKGQYESVLKLIDNRKKIKAALVKANAVTVVEIAGESMTLAEAIERRNSINHEAVLLRVLSQQFSKVTNKVELENISVQERLDNLLESQFGKDGKTKNDDTKDLIDLYNTKHAAKIVDPIGLRNVIQKYQDKYDQFSTEVDFILSETNAKTEIEVHLD
ncbi:hypothetical protein [Gottfriedia solisilvae]|uniref:Uncharacterized protein n=1 Tax=Gottfriedia solisilvae TaxID=1516104 RepID=A0A8J3AKW0_9BACI|nr:hypothetical protein [Gottfriedia solisilvae]GGI16303.1 hypothetical protein GCM10007380_32290 [Gottfriedia solisilvae]